MPRFPLHPVNPGHICVDGNDIAISEIAPPDSDIFELIGADESTDKTCDPWAADAKICALVGETCKQWHHLKADSPVGVDHVNRITDKQKATYAYYGNSIQDVISGIKAGHRVLIDDTLRHVYISDNQTALAARYHSPHGTFPLCTINAIPNTDQDQERILGLEIEQTKTPMATLPLFARVYGTQPLISGAPSRVEFLSGRTGQTLLTEGVPFGHHSGWMVITTSGSHGRPQR